MKSILNIFILFIISIQFTYAQSGSITGKITIDNSLEKLANVNVKVLELSLGTVSNSAGKYSFKNIPDGNYTIQFSHIGFKITTKKIKLKNSKNIDLNVILLHSRISLAVATIVSLRTDKII
jgi:iron complex outermembrane receptor protein